MDSLVSLILVGLNIRATSCMRQPIARLDVVEVRCNRFQRCSLGYTSDCDVCVDEQAQICYFLCDKFYFRRQDDVTSQFSIMQMSSRP